MKTGSEAFELGDWVDPSWQSSKGASGRWVSRAIKLGMSGVTGTRMGRSPAVIYTLEPFPVHSLCFWLFSFACDS